MKTPVAIPALLPLLLEVVPYLPVSRPSPQSSAGRRIAALAEMDKIVRSNTEMLGTKRKESSKERQQAKALEAQANKQWKLGLLALKLNRTDDYFARLGALLQSCGDSIGSRNNSVKRKLVADWQVDIASELQFGLKSLTPSLIRIQESRDALAGGLDDILKRDGDALWEGVAYASSYCRLAQVDMQRRLTPSSISDMRCNGVQCAIDLFSLGLGNVLTSATRSDHLTRQQRKSIAADASESTAPSLDGLTPIAANALEGADSDLDDLDGTTQLITVTMECELFLLAQVNALRVDYEGESGGKTAFAALQQLRVGSKTLAEIRLHAEHWPLPEDAGMERLHWSAIARLDERQEVLDTLIEVVVNDLDTFRPDGPPLGTPDGTEATQSPKTSDTVVPEPVNAKTSTAKVETSQAASKAPEKLSLPDIGLHQLSDPAELPAPALRKRWFVEMCLVLKGLKSNREGPAGSQAGLSSQNLGNMARDVHTRFTAAQAMRNDFLKEITSASRLETAGTELKALMLSAHASADLLVTLGDRPFEGADRAMTLRNLGATLGRAAALENLLERELPLLIADEHVIDAAIDPNLPADHPPATVPQRGISVVPTENGPMLRIKLMHQDGDGPAWLASIGADIEGLDRKKTVAVTDAWVLHWHLADEHRDKAPQQIEIEKLDAGDLGFGSSKPGRFEFDVEKRSAASVGRGLRHRTGKPPCSLTPALALTLIKDNPSKLVRA